LISCFIVVDQQYVWQCHVLITLSSSNAVNIQREGEVLRTRAIHNNALVKVWPRMGAVFSSGCQRTPARNIVYKLEDCL
jgi:hypothetical protein